jgi:hypothetical protein
MKITKNQLKKIIAEAMDLDLTVRPGDLEGAPVTATYYEQGYEDAVAGRDHRYKGASGAGTQYNYREYVEGYNEGLGEE